MTVYDFDTGAHGDYVEQLHVPGYSYFKTPLRPASDDRITTTIDVDQSTRTFTARAIGTSADNPTQPKTLTNLQASKGVQFFFIAQYGFVDAQFTVT